jgi:hypothetical protein
MNSMQKRFNFRRVTITGWTLAPALVFLSCLGPALAEENGASPAEADTSMALSGDQEGTVFKSLTIEGENRVQITFDRPELDIDLDPSQAPGLTWGSSMDVLNRTVPDLNTPLLNTSAHFRSPYRIRPWITAFETGPVATFNSDLESVHRWTLLVVDSRGREVVQFEGKKNPPRRIEWDGRKQDGNLALPGLTYSYVLEAFDKAGNKRRFVGDGFQLEAYRRDFEDSQEFLISGNQWTGAARKAQPGASAYLLETASWLNMKTGSGEPVIITATAGSYADAKALGDQVAAELRPLLPGDGTRVAVTAIADPGSPPGGILQIRTGLMKPGQN